MAKYHFSYAYGGRIENLSYIQLLFFIIGFPDPENMGVDTKIALLNGLEAKILPKTQLFNDCLVAILFCPLKKSSRMPSWHPPDSDSGSVQDDE